MTLAAIIALIPGFFKFFDEVKWFIELLQKTPAEKKDVLIKSLQEESVNLAKTGRPTWG